MSYYILVVDIDAKQYISLSSKEGGAYFLRVGYTY